MTFEGKHHHSFKEEPHEHLCHDHEDEIHEHYHENGECDDPEGGCHHEHHHHDHEHHHEEHDHDEPISVTTHDLAVVGTVNIALSLSYEKAVEEIEKRMHSVSEIIEKENGFIGHIKALIEEEGRKCRISITEEESVDRKWMEGGMSTRVECVFIVFGIQTDSLKKLLEEVFHEYV